jgi:hypothetical protein
VVALWRFIHEKSRKDAQEVAIHNKFQHVMDCYLPYFKERSQTLNVVFPHSRGPEVESDKTYVTRAEHPLFQEGDRDNLKGICLGQTQGEGVDSQAILSRPNLLSLLSLFLTCESGHAKQENSDARLGAVRVHRAKMIETFENKNKHVSDHGASYIEILDSAIFAMRFEKRDLSL